MANIDTILKAKVDLSNCDQEPIHRPGAIQPHGLLVAVAPNTTSIEVISGNVSKFFGVDPAEALGTKIEKYFDVTSVETLRAALDTTLKKPSLRPVKVKTSSGILLDAIVHRSGQLAILELEPVTSEADMGFTDFYQVVHNAVRRLQSVSDLVDLAQYTAEEIRRLTKFDRVMVYRFDEDWHGEVIAESKVEHIEAFLGLHYPASDIPVQARKLYTENWIRLIADVSYEAAGLMSHDANLAANLDLSHSVLRSVSPMHVKYLKNMGVGASMSVSLMKDGKLWGLVACHHYSPKFIPYEIRLGCEFLGQILSWRVGVKEAAAYYENLSHAQTIQAAITASLASSNNIEQDIIASAEKLVSMVDSDGVAVKFRGHFLMAGLTPSKPQVGELLTWLQDEMKSDSYHTDQLSMHFPRALPYAAVASGILACQISPESEDFIVWFRAEKVRSVNWAGNPNNFETDPENARLNPRGSFALWKETVHNTSERWAKWEIAAAEGLLNSIRLNVLKNLNEVARLNEGLQRASRAKDEFIAMVSHELRTPLNAIIGWSDLLDAGDLPQDEWPSALATIRRNAKAQSRLIEDLLDISRIISGKLRLDVEEIEAHSFVSAAIEAVRPAADAKNIKFHAVLDPYAGLLMGDSARLQQVVWNLLVNAVKFTPKGGKVFVRLMRQESSVVIIVEDTGQGIDETVLPYVFERFKQADSSISRQHAGLGLGLAIVKHLIELHGGRVTAESAGLGKGAVFRVSLPINVISTNKQSEATQADQRGEQICPPALENLKVLLIDDEPDARAFLRLVLMKCKAVVEQCGSVEEGIEQVAKFKPDVIVSDIGMPILDGYEFIKRLRQLPADQGGRTPAVALTAFARTEDRTRALVAGFQAHVAKPVSQDEFLAVVASIAGRNFR